MRLIECFKQIEHKPRLAFVVAILFLVLLTVVSTYVLYYRLSIYEEPGGWGRTLDRGFPDFGVLILQVATYLPALVLVLFHRSRYREIVLFATSILFLVLIVGFEIILANYDLGKNSDDALFLSMVGRVLIVFLSATLLSLFTVIKLIKKHFFNKNRHSRG